MKKSITYTKEQLRDLAKKNERLGPTVTEYFKSQGCFVEEGDSRVSYQTLSDGAVVVTFDDKQGA